METVSRNVFKETTKEPRVEEVTFKRKTLPLDRAELAERLRLPFDAQFLVNGKAIQGLEVQWLETDAAQGESVQTTNDERPWLLCRECPVPRRIRGKGPYESHMKWHKKQEAKVEADRAKDATEFERKPKKARSK